MSIKLSRILHAGYLLDHTTDLNSTTIAFDPIFENPFSGNCFAYPPVEFNVPQIKDLRLSAVFISHYHDDHCSLESLNLLHRDTPIYLYCLHDELFKWIRELGFKSVFALELNQSVEISTITVIPRRALDWDVDCLFEITAGGVHILNVVDSWIDSSTLELLKQQAAWDLILWPFQTMRELEVLSPRRSSHNSPEIPHEWLDQLQQLQPQFVIPSSCQFLQESGSWYNHYFFPITYKMFEQCLNNILPNTKVIRLNPSESIHLSSQAFHRTEPLHWIKPIGEQNVDYCYNPNLPIPSTASIAQMFPCLDLQQKESIIEFCQKNLIQKYKSLKASEEPYFDQQRFWRLSLFDSQEPPIDFYYSLERSTLQLLDSPPAYLSWTTEIPLFKLHRALNYGETLTSLYIRINDACFEPAIEYALAQCDILSDPLVRCLYEGVFGQYQWAQLQRLKMDQSE